MRGIGSCILVIGIFLASAGLAENGLQPGARQSEDSFRNGNAIPWYDFSEVVSDSARKINGVSAIRLDKIFTDWKKETFIHVSEMGHVAVFSGGKRLDGRLLYVLPVTLEPSTRLAEHGLIIRLKAPNEATREAALNALVEKMNAWQNRHSLTCVNGGCEMGKDAGAPLPTIIFPRQLVEYVAENGVQWKGQEIGVEFIATQPMNLRQYLAHFRKASYKLLPTYVAQVATEGCKRIWQLFR